MGSSPQHPQSQAQQSVLHDARAVHDIASLDVKDYLLAKQPSWIIARIVPGMNSGSSTVPGAHIKAETGEFVRPSNSRLMTVKEGSWKALFAARETSIREGVYAWQEPLEEKRILVAEDHYSPFIHGGTVIFRPQPGEKGIAQFAASRSLFSEWADQAPSALVFAAGHPDLAQPGLIGGDNKVLAVLAFRELIAAGHLTKEFALDHLRRTEGQQCAVCGYLLLGNVRHEHEVAEAVRSARNADRLSSIALGMFAAWLLSSHAETRARALAVISSIHTQMNELNAVPDDYLRTILHRVGTPR